MKAALVLMLLILSFAPADAQMGTIKVKKSKCDCPYTDTTFMQNSDLSRPWDNSQTGVTIKGVVLTDSVTKKPVSGAAVWYTVNKKKKKLATNEKGEFIILNGPLGSYSFFVSYPCYTNGGGTLGPYPSATFIPATFYLKPCTDYSKEIKNTSTRMKQGS